MSLMPPAQEPQGPALTLVPDTLAFLGQLVTRIQQALSDELRIERWRGHPNHLAGHCQTASEVLWRLGGEEAGFQPRTLAWEDTEHWYLVRPESGTVIDPTVGQFITVPDYEGSPASFPEEPSEEAAAIIERLCIN